MNPRNGQHGKPLDEVVTFVDGVFPLIQKTVKNDAFLIMSQMDKYIDDFYFDLILIANGGQFDEFAKLSVSEGRRHNLLLEAGFCIFARTKKLFGGES